MQKKIIEIEGFWVVGLSVRTNNHNEMNPSTAKIGLLVADYFGQNVAAGIANRVNPGVTIDGFTEYDSDEFGDYTYFIGEAVSKVEEREGLRGFEVLKGKYVKFTTPEGQMPEVVFHAWQKIWKMKSDELGGKRTYRIDYEVYDERARDPNKTVMDICLGIV